MNISEIRNPKSEIVLQEYGSTEAALSPDTYNILRTRYPKQLEVAHTAREGIYRVTARDFVGRISLPGGGLLVIRPKVGISNLFYMLCVDAGLADFHPPPTGLDEDPEIFPFIIAALLAAVEHAIAGGLYRDYNRLEERLPYIRGRINLAEQARTGWLHHRHTCSYADHTADTPENRVLAATLRLLPALLLGRDEGYLTGKARSLLSCFNEVPPIRRSEAIALLPRLRIHRLNALYGPAIALSGLALRGLTLNEQAGAHPYASFLVQMPRLFESFLIKRLARLLPRHGLRVVAQKHDYLDEERKVGIRPDILVYGAHERNPRLVLDAKYRRSDGPDADPNRDLYQVSAYLDRYNLQSGALVYPRFAGEEGTHIGLRGTLKRLHILTLNLGALTPALLDEDCARIARHIAKLATNPTHVG